MAFIITMMLFLKSTLLPAAKAVVFGGTWLASLQEGVGSPVAGGVVLGWLIASAVCHCWGRRLLGFSRSTGSGQFVALY
jgi:hypothetical protein